MQPDSLVFVAILGAWAAYLLPRWVTRRDALGQSRTRDRHSAHMRVLTRRRRRTAGASSAPLLRTSPLLSARTATPTASADADSVASPAPAASPAMSPAMSPARSASVRAARRRARVLLTLLVLASVSWAVVALLPVPVWAAAPATGLLALDLVALVLSGRRRSRARRAVATQVARRVAAADRAVARRTGSGRAPARQTPAAARRAADPTQPLPVVADVPSPVQERRAAERRIAPRRAADRAVAARLVADRVEDAAAAVASSDGTWTPRAVPPPTYTLKPVVARPEPRPLDLSSPGPAGPSALAAVAAVASAGTPAPRPWETEHTWADDLDDVLARRRAVNG